MHAKRIIHDILPRFFGIASKLKGEEGFVLPDGKSFPSEAGLFRELCPSLGLGRSSFFDYKNLWTNKESKPTRKYLIGELSKKAAIKELSDLGLVKNTGKRKGAGDGGEDGTKKQKRGGGGGDSGAHALPVDV